MNDTIKPKFDPVADAAKLDAMARRMTYNGTQGEAEDKHTMFEIAMRLRTGGYAPTLAMAPSIHEMNYRAAMDAVESLRAENVALKAKANAVKLDDEPVGTSDPFRDAVWGAVQEALGDAYDCTRSWAAWGCNTMSEDDFHRVADQPDRVDEIVAAVFKALPASVSKVHTWSDMDAIAEDPKVFDALQDFSADPTGDGGVVIVEAMLNALGLKTFREWVGIDLASPIHAQDGSQALADAPQPASSKVARLTSEDEVVIRRLVDELLEIDFVKLEQGRHVLHTSGPVTFDCLRALFIAGLDSGIKSVLSQWPVLKGIGKVAGDGFKDTTKVGEVVYAWNQEQPSPFKPGQYPRVGNHCGWTASTDQFEFKLATVDEVRNIFAEQEAAWAKAAQRLVTWRYCMSYNDSYFGEPAGLVKQVADELERLMPLLTCKAAETHEGGAA